MQRLKEFNREHPMIMPALVGIVLYILLFGALWLFIRPDLGDATQKKDFAQLMAQIAGGLALLFGLYFTWRRVEISQRTLETQQDQQVTERFTRAIDQLGNTDDKGNKRTEIRLGGIYALERIAKDSPERDYSTIVEVLSAYVRENARRAPEEGDKGQDKKREELPRLPADIQAVLDVLKRLREDPELQEYLSPLDLRGTDLRGADLQEANLQRADLRGANLQEANLQEAYLIEANLQEADLQEANLTNAEVSKEQLGTAYSLQGATMPDGSVVHD